MTIDQAIKKAIEGGWKIHSGYADRFISASGKYAYFTVRDLTNGKTHTDIERVFLDPLFWQSLGKALGWSIEPRYMKPDITEEETYEIMPDWIGNWHRFIDHLALGKTPEEFFNALT